MLGLSGVFGGIKSFASKVVNSSNSQLNSLRAKGEKKGNAWGRGVRGGVRLGAKIWTKGRDRLVHVEYPSRIRSPLQKGYVNILRKDKLPDAERAQRERNRRNPLALRYGGKIPMDKALPLIEKRKEVALVFAKGFTHELLEAFTMKEVLELEAMLPKIKAAMDKAGKAMPKEVEEDRKARHIALGLSKSTRGSMKLVGEETTISLLPEDLKKKITGVTAGEKAKVIA